MHSYRRPFRLTIESHEKCSEASKLSKMIQRFAVHVRKLEFSSDKLVDIADFAYIMHPMINLAEVTFEDLDLDGNVERIEHISIELPSLERIFFKNCHENFMDIFLRVKANSLKEFTAFSDNFLNFEKVFNCNKNIKHLTMTGDVAYPNATKHLHLTHLRIFTDDPIFRQGVIEHQRSVKYLSFLLEDDPYKIWSDVVIISNVKDEEFSLICSLAKLETLRIQIGRLLPDVFAGIENLKNLNELTMKAVGEDEIFCDNYQFYTKKMDEFLHFEKMFRKLITIPIPKLAALTWSVMNCEFNEFFEDDDVFIESYFDNINQFSYINVFGTMAVSFPNLKYLKIEMPESLGLFSIHDVLKCFPHLETLMLDVNIDIESKPIIMHTNMTHNDT